VGVRATLDAVNEVRDLAEEGVVVRVSVTLLDVIAGSSQVKNGRVVRVDQPHLETVTDDLQLARVGGSLKGDGVDEATDSTILVFPGGASHSGNPQLFGNLALVNRNSAKLTGSLVPLDRVSLNRGDVDISTEVSREITEVSTLLDNGTHVDSLVPPSGLGNGLVSTSVSRDGTHDGQVVGSDDLLHLLDASQVTKHVSNRDDVARVDQSLGEFHSLGDGTTGDGLLNKVGRVGEELQQPELEVSRGFDSASVSRRRSDNNGVGFLLRGHGLSELLDRLVDDSVSVSRLYETGPLAGQDGLGTRDGRVDQGNDLESGTELVLESERVVPRTFVTSEHDVPGSDHGNVEIGSRSRRRLEVHRTRHFWVNPILGRIVQPSIRPDRGLRDESPGEQRRADGLVAVQGGETGADRGRLEGRVGARSESTGLGSNGREDVAVQSLSAEVVHKAHLCAVLSLDEVYGGDGMNGEKRTEVGVPLVLYTRSAMNLFALSTS